jgi:hypothetical protein
MWRMLKVQENCIDYRWERLLMQEESRRWRRELSSFSDRRHNGRFHGR